MPLVVTRKTPIADTSLTLWDTPVRHREQSVDDDCVFSSNSAPNMGPRSNNPTTYSVKLYYRILELVHAAFARGTKHLRRPNEPPFRSRVPTQEARSLPGWFRLQRSWTTLRVRPSERVAIEMFRWIIAASSQKETRGENQFFGQLYKL